MGNAFVAGLKNEAPRGGDITDEDRRQRCTKRDAEGSELSYSCIVCVVLGKVGHNRDLSAVASCMRHAVG